MRKRILSLLLAVAMCLSLLPAAVSAAEAVDITPTQPKSAMGVYYIGTVGELYWFAQHVNEGNPSATAWLTANITVNENVLDQDGNLKADRSALAAWTPIGATVPFTGTFDGQGHTISGLYVSSDARYAGLFSQAGANAKIRDLTLTDSYIEGTAAAGEQTLGGICGYAGNARIEKCTNGATISGGKSGSYLGGIVGEAEQTPVVSCVNSGLITGERDHAFGGGLCGSIYGGKSEVNLTGENTGMISLNGAYSEVGGICGHALVCAILDCTNSGMIYAVSSTENESYAGGICGYADGAGDEVSVTLDNCTNSGFVTASGHAGGLCGKSINGATVQNSTNTSSITGTLYGGGICGQSVGGLMNSCANTGVVAQTGSNKTGGIAGETDSDTVVANCFTTTDSLTGDTAAGIYNSYYWSETTDMDNHKMSAEDFAGGKAAYQLSQGTKVGIRTYWGFKWGQNLGTDPYPVINGPRVYISSPCAWTYSNGDAVEHDYDADGVCKNCGAVLCKHPDVDSDGNCTGCGEAMVAKLTVGETSVCYPTIAEALKAACTEENAGCTVTVIAKNSLVPMPNGIYMDTKGDTGVTLDLNGHSLSDYALNVGGDRRSGKLAVTDSSGGNGFIHLTVRDGGDVTVSGGYATTCEADVYGGSLKLYGVAFSDTRLYNDIPASSLLPEGYAFYRFYDGSTLGVRVKLSDADGNVTNRYKMVAAPCDHYSVVNAVCEYCGRDFSDSVARVDRNGKEYYFASFAAAVEYAKPYAGTRVTLLKDDTTAESVNGSSLGTYTIDWNGHTLTCTRGAGFALVLNGGCNVTLLDSSEEQNGGIICTGNGMAVTVDMSTAAIQSGRYVGRVSANGSKAKLRISGGVFKSVGSAGNAQYLYQMLEDGYAFSTTQDETGLVNLYENMSTPSGQTIYVVAHTHDVSSGQCTCGLPCAHETVDDNGKCTVCQEQVYVAKLTADNVKFYADFRTAVQAAKDASASGTAVTLTMLEDFRPWGEEDEPDIVLSGSYTLDLNGHFLVVIQNVVCTSGAITICNSSETAEGFVTGHVQLEDGMQLTVLDGIVDSMTVKSGCSAEIRGGRVDRNVTIQSGGSITILNNISFYGLLLIQSGGSAFIQSGRFGKLQTEGDLLLKDLLADGKAFLAANDRIQNGYVQWLENVTVIDHTSHTFVDGKCACGLTAPKESAKLTQAPAALELTYDGTEQNLVSAGVAEGGTVVYSTAKDGPYSEEIPTGTNAGTYTVYYKVVGDQDHLDVAEASIQVEIAKAEVTVSVLPQKAYTTEPIPSLDDPQENIHYQIKGLIGGDSLMARVVLSYEKTPDMTKPGEYVILVTIEGEDSNYDVKTQNGVLTVEEYPYSVYDVNHDGVINLLDVTRTQRYYGLSKEDAGWNPLADVNHDGIVDISDLILILNNYFFKV